jgi:uncharacterized protein YjbI with pentapeptide repeats/uncharacterized membrane protein YiaA
MIENRSASISLVSLMPESNPPPNNAPLTPADSLELSDPSLNNPNGDRSSSPLDARTLSGLTESALSEPSRGYSSLQTFQRSKAPLPVGWIIVLALVLMTIGLFLGNAWLGGAGAIVALLISLRVIATAAQKAIAEILSPEQQLLTLSLVGVAIATVGLLHLMGLTQPLSVWYYQLNWDVLGSTGEVIGAVGQILIAILAVFVAWRQYVISKDLTIQQNTITQQQTIDSYFQGVSELVLDEDGLLEDWPQERAIAEGRTAAILSSIDGNGKAKVLRFLSRSRLLTPIKRDRRLGRAILDGMGGYAEDRAFGVRVVDLGVMLAGSDLSKTDLRWTDLTDINLIRINLYRADLVKTNFARTILCEASLVEADLMGTRFFYGSAKTATPRSRIDIPNYATGEHTGAVVEDADFTNAQRLSEEQRYYCCAWGGARTRGTIPGGCDGIPNLLGR